MRGGMPTILYAIALAAWGLACGNALEGVLEVRSAYVNIDKGVFLLYARVEYPESPAIRDALRDGMVDADGLTFRRFSVAAQNRLRNYPWPDNVRELRHLVHRLLIHGGAEEIRLEEIERELAVQTPPDEPLVKQDLLALPLREAREQFERAYLQQQLLLCSGKVGQLAKRVGMDRTHLYRKLRSLGVDFRNISDE